MNEEQRCWSCTYFNAGPSECTYPPMNLPEATWKFITAHHAHPVKTTPHGGAECATYDRKPGRPDPDPDARMCGNCELFDADGSQCLWDGPVPTSLNADECSVTFYDGTNCPTFKKREPEIAPGQASNTCGACKWWEPWKTALATGACDFPILTPASRTYPVDKAPMHETEGDDCRCFERKDG